MTSAQPFERRSFAHGEQILGYEVHGRGERTVVLIHGLLMDANMNRALGRALAAHGSRVLLLDLPGHGSSSRPRRAVAHRMDLYARQVVALLDELGIERAVIGGASLGADVALQVAVSESRRVQGLIIEMPVLESGAPVAALTFVPMLLALHYLHPLFRVVAGVTSRLPRVGRAPIDSLLEILSADPDEAAAVLHGVLLGPVAPTEEQRRAISAPTLVIGHRGDPLHPYADARSLARMVPTAELVEARSIAELRWSPGRLTAEIVGFVERAWPETPRASVDRRSG